MDADYDIYLSPPVLTGVEKDYISQALDSGWISPFGPSLHALENKFNERFYEKGVVLTSSGTAAIHLALQLSHVKPGDWVICPASTFHGVANAICKTGAIPVFLDVDSRTWGLDPGLLHQALKEHRKKIKAVLAVHNYGFPCNMEEISNLCREYQITLIEDAAESLGSANGKVLCGSTGDFSIFSFNGNKIVTGSSGGALLCPPRLESVARSLIHHNRGGEPEAGKIGDNYQFSNILAALVFAQLSNLQERIDKKRLLFTQYRRLLEPLNYDFQREQAAEIANRWLSVFLFQHSGFRGSSLIKHMASHGIECRRIWKPLHTWNYFTDYPAYDTGVSRRLHQLGICLPSGIDLTSEQIAFVWSKLEEAVYERS